MENLDFRPGTVNKPTKMKIYCPYCGKNNGQVRLNFSLRPTLILACKFCSEEFSLGPVGSFNKLNEPMIMMFADNNEHQFICPFDGKKDFEDTEIWTNLYHTEYEKVKLCKNCKRVFQYRYFNPHNEEHLDYWEQWKNDQIKNNWNTPLDNVDEQSKI